uniref:Secreted protein n=1 Tax=Panagrellus redivivus TaxID=6233 RepID=A0A7E4VCV7_PANRE
MQRLTSLLLSCFISAAVFATVHSRLNTVAPPEYFTALLNGYRVPSDDSNIIVSPETKRNFGRVASLSGGRGPANHPLCFFTALPCYSYNKRPYAPDSDQ